VELGSTQPLTEMSTRGISWGKGDQCVRLTTLSLSCAVVMKSGNLNFLEPSGPLQAYNGTALSLIYIHIPGVSRLVHITAGGDFLGLCDQKSSYKHVSDFGRFRSYDCLKLRIEGNDY